MFRPGRARSRFRSKLHQRMETAGQRRLVTDLLASFKSLESNAQLEVWNKMIDNHQFDLSQLISLRTAIDDRIKIDIISCVPYHIALYIMSFLKPKDIGQAAQTCRSWRVVCEDNRLWREKCKEEGLLEDEQALNVLFRRRILNSHARQEKLVNEVLSSVPRSEWKAAYLKHISILRNWKSRNFEISEPFIAPVQPAQERERSVKLRPVAQEMSLQTNCRTTPSSSKITLRHPGTLVGSSSKSSVSDKDEKLDYNNIVVKEEGEESRLGGDDFFSGYQDVDGSKSHLMQLRCHEDSVITCLQYNPATSTIVSGSDDQTLKVWSSVTGQCINTLEGHTGGVWSSQLSPDDIVVSGSTDRTLKVWKAHTGELMHTLEGHMSTVRCLALDGNKVVSGSRDTTLRLWDIFEGVCINVFAGHGAAVRCVEYKNNIIVSGAYDHLVMVWDALTGSLLHALECHASRIYSLQFDGKTIASGSLDSNICVWDVSSGKLCHRLEGHQSLTSKMQLRGDLLVSANADSYCKVWNIRTGECLQTLGGENKHKSAITSVYFNNRHVVTSSDDGTVKLWDIRTGDFIKDLIVLPTASRGGVVWRIRASYTKLICAVGSRTQTEDTHLLVMDFNDE